MSWIFPAFFGVLTLALLVYIMMSVRERMHPREQVVCVLESRQREKFPKLTLFGRRDRVDDELFRKMLASAAADSAVSLRQIEARQQSPDHPILWNVPETDYLKFYIFQVV